MKYIVQVWCTGMGWVDSKYGADLRCDAELEEIKLLANDSSWVNPQTERQTRIRENFT